MSSIKRWEACRVSPKLEVGTSVGFSMHVVGVGDYMLVGQAKTESSLGCSQVVVEEAIKDKNELNTSHDTECI